MDHRYKKFLAVAETGSFSAAAKKLHITQPAITIAIASLERAFGVKLYTRKKYAVELTEQGKVVARAAKKIDLEISKMRQDLTGDTNIKSCNVGIIDTIAHLAYRSPDNNSFFSNLEVMVDNSKRIINALLTESIDVGVITGQTSSINKDISILKLHDEEFVFVTAPHLAPAKAVNSIDDWLAVNKESTSYLHFTKLFKKLGLTVHPIFHSTSIELLKEMAVAGKGTALLPKHMVKESITNGTLAIVNTKHLYRPIWAVVKNNNNRQPIADITGYIDKLLARS